MKRTKVLSDLIASAIGAKTHYDLWWAQVSDAKPKFASVMNQHSDFFLASQDAHYTAFFVYFAHLFDKRKDASSIQTYIKILNANAKTEDLRELEAHAEMLSKRAAPLLTLRHNIIAHVNAQLSETDVFGPLQITWNEIRSVIHDSASFVAKLAGASYIGEVGIPRDDRLKEAAIKLLSAIQQP
jgi:hypothetical protein